MAVEIQQLMNPLTIDTVVSELCIEQQKALMAKYRKLTEDQSAVNDTRLVHLCCYMVVSQAPQGVMDAAISEEVLQRLPLDSFPKGSHHAIQNAAYRKMRSLGSDDDRAELQVNYRELTRSYLALLSFLPAQLCDWSCIKTCFVLHAFLYVIV